MYRRSFIQKSILGLGAATLSTSLANKSNGTSINAMNKVAFMSECGVLGKDANYLLGFMMVDNPQIHEDALVQLRSQTGYRSTLNYRSNDIYKIDFAKAAIDYFWNSSDITLVLSRESLPAPQGAHNYTLKEKNTFKVDFTNSILTRFGAINSPDAVVSKYHSLNGPSRGFISEFETGTNLAYAAEVTHNSNLVQLSSFICGSITASLNKQVTHPVKIELIDYLTNKIGITDFTIDHDTNKIKYYS